MAQLLAVVDYCTGCIRELTLLIRVFLLMGFYVSGQAMQLRNGMWVIGEVTFSKRACVGATVSAYVELLAHTCIPRNC